MFQFGAQKQIAQIIVTSAYLDITVRRNAVQIMNWTKVINVNQYVKSNFNKCSSFTIFGSYDGYKFKNGSCTMAVLKVQKQYIIYSNQHHIL
ncbi:unnamed protein product [Paramecium sonneborni]|uniref:Uncharacterized protein n=1 Tax=Paramecium sonneborni TaxID=65129 RepID=A0A8S1RK80_9CILI|nr:unnamed protein product [Paramecium sonneborni]